VCLISPLKKPGKKNTLFSRKEEFIIPRRILSRLQDVNDDFSAEDVTKEMRRACVEYMKYNLCMTMTAIAETFQVQRKTIYNDFQYLMENTPILQEIELDALAKSVLLKNENLQFRLRAEGKYYESWKLELDKIRVLQELGLVRRSPIELKNVNITYEDYVSALRQAGNAEMNKDKKLVNLNPLFQDSGNGKDEKSTSENS